MIGAETDVPGFADPVADAQATFRALLDAMARPGRVCAIASALAPPAPLDVATAAVALTLIDQETVLHLDAAMRAAAPWLTFHAGPPMSEDAEAADFVLAAICPDLSRLRAGTDEAPEASATLILQIASLGGGTPYRLTGPGLAEPCILRAAGLPRDFIAAWQRNHSLFPRGIDAILCAGDKLAALPRTVTLEAG